MKFDQITFELFSKSNIDKICEIQRDDISEDFVDTADTIMELTQYGLEHNCKGHTYAIKRADEYIGLILLGEAFEWDSDPEEMKGVPFYRLMGFVIDRRYRSGGIGSYVLEKTIELIYEEFGVRPIALGVHKDNIGAERFYIDHGFRKTDVMEGNDYYYLRYPNEKNNIKIALASARIVDRDIKFNLLQMEKYMKKARAEGAELVCFGEAFLQGFNALSWQYEKDGEMALTTDSHEFKQIKELTKDIGIDVMFGYNELASESIYSSCALISNGEIIHNYRRISKGWKEYWKTDDHYKEGSTVESFDYKGRKCAIALCGDLWDESERFEIGEDILFWPVYVSWTREEWENGGKIEYARQAGLCCENTLYINSLCDNDAFGGAAHFFKGKIESELPIFHESLLYVTIRT